MAGTKQLGDILDKERFLTEVVGTQRPLQDAEEIVQTFVRQAQALQKEIASHM